MRDRDYSNGTGKIGLTLEFREDGGLRVYSDDLPGLMLSHSDPRKVIADISPALETLLTIMHYLRTGETPIPDEQHGE